MEWLIRALVTGVTCFAATNVDDIILLMMFFSQVNHSFRPRHIILGQYLGFMLLLLACVPGFLGGMVLPESWIGLLGFVPILIGLKQLLTSEPEEPEVQTVSTSDHWLSKLPLANWLHPRTYQVAAVTVANGGDNIGIYIPVFASSNLPTLAVIVTTFLVLVAVWCYAARFLASHPTIAPLLNRYADRVVPFVLIGLGIYILIENGSYRLLPLFAVVF